MILYTLSPNNEARTVKINKLITTYKQHSMSFHAFTNIKFKRSINDNIYAQIVFGTHTDDYGAHNETTISCGTNGGGWGQAGSAILLNGIGKTGDWDDTGRVMFTIWDAPYGSQSHAIEMNMNASRINLRKYTENSNKSIVFNEAASNRLIYGCGLKIQRGWLTVSASATSITFPIAFSSTRYTVLATHAGSAVNNDMIIVKTSDRTVSGCKLNCIKAGTGYVGLYVRWLAIGY